VKKPSPFDNCFSEKKAKRLKGFEEEREFNNRAGGKTRERLVAGGPARAREIWKADGGGQ